MPAIPFVSKTHEWMGQHGHAVKSKRSTSRGLTDNCDKLIKCNTWTADGSANKSTDCSFIGPEFNSFHPSWAVHNCLLLQDHIGNPKIVLFTEK